MDAMGERLEGALRQLVADLGNQVADEPERVRGGLVDVLGADARPLRAAVDALVVASEEGVGAALAEGGDGTTELTARLAGRGVPADVAAASVATWADALRPVPVGVEGPRLAETLLPLLGTDDLEPPPGEATLLPAGDATLLPAGESAGDDPDGTGAVAAAVGLEAGSSGTAGAWRSRRLPLAIVGVAAAFVLALVGLTLALAGGGDPENTEVLAADESRDGDGSTTSTVTTTTLAPVAETTSTVPVDPAAPIDPNAVPTSVPGGSGPGPRVTPTTAAGGPGNPVPTPTAPPATAPPATAPPATAPPVTAAPVTAPPPPPPEPLVANGDVYTYTVAFCGASPCQANLTLLDNDGGPYNWVDFMSNPTHGSISWQTSFAGYVPHHNGYFADYFTYRLRNTVTGAVSATVGVSVTAYCSTDANQCYS